MKDNKVNSTFYELEKANSISFEKLLYNVDAVVSEWSSVLYEAFNHGKKAITISEYGRDAYEEFIIDKKIAYAKNSSDLIKIIFKKNNPNKNKVSFYNAEAIKFFGV